MSTWTTDRPAWEPTVTVDPDSAAVYVYLRPAQPAAFTVAVSDWINIDYDEHGAPIGVEILS